MIPGMPPLWPPQQRAITEFFAAVEAGFKRICITIPTGGGKTRVMAELAHWGRQRLLPVVLFTNRRLITKQSAKVFGTAGIDHGIMAANYEPALLENVQIASFQSVDSRVSAKRWVLPRGRLILVDEGHANKGPRANRVMKKYRDEGAIIVYLTATPVGMGAVCDKLIIGGTKSELRAIGALVKCLVFAPDEPDLQGVKRVRVRDGDDREIPVELSDKAAGKRLMETLVFGDVFMHWRRHNPQRLPTVLFAPGVPESKWFVEEWRKLGVTAEHIDGDTLDVERDRIFAASEAGECQVICSQGVLREGVDMPWLYCGILCQPCHNLSTFWQIVGRLLRACEGKDHCILIDHAGAWWRHPSPNADYEWTLETTDAGIAAERKRNFEKGESEPIRCPMCSGIRARGPVCPHCGFQHEKSVRLVRMVDGTLSKKDGNVHPKVSKQQNDERIWKTCLFACGNAKRKMTLKQVLGYYCKKAGGPLPQSIMATLPGRDSCDWNRYVTDVFPWLTRKRRAKSS